MNELDTVLNAVCEAFGENTGLTVLRAHPFGGKHRFSAPLLAVSVRGGEGAAAGFAEYLGERYDDGQGCTVETYGKRLTVTLGADVYAPDTEADGAEACLSAVSETLHAISCLPAGIKVRKFTCGETKFDSETGMYLCPVDIECLCILYAESAGGDGLSAFTLKGEIR